MRLGLCEQSRELRHYSVSLQSGILLTCQSHQLADTGTRNRKDHQLGERRGLLSRQTDLPYIGIIPKPRGTQPLQIILRVSHADSE
jgi:hypothetical protein